MQQWYFNKQFGPYTGNRYDPEDIEIEERPTPNHTFDEEQWQAPPEPTLEQLKTAKLVELSDRCTEEIELGFESTALGSVHHYGGKLDNQMNLFGGVLLGTSIPHTCTDSEGIKTQRLHTNAQIKKALQDGGIAKIALTAKYNGLRSEVNAATNKEELAAIVW